MEIISLLAIIALIVWIVMQFAPGPGWIAKAALIVWMVCITILTTSLNISA